jgi:hypothetical protein
MKVVFNRQGYAIAPLLFDWLKQLWNGNIFRWKVSMILLPIASAAWWSVSKVRDERYSIKAAAKTAVLMELDHKSFHLQNWFWGIIKESSKVFPWQLSSNGWTEVRRAGTAIMAWRVGSEYYHGWIGLTGRRRSRVDLVEQTNHCTSPLVQFIHLFLDPLQ